VRTVILNLVQDFFWGGLTREDPQHPNPPSSLFNFSKEGTKNLPFLKGDLVGFHLGEIVMVVMIFYNKRLNNGVK
jgi:hypothetical protein